MSKSNSEPQGVFSFFDEVEKTEPAQKPKRNPLRPPKVIEAGEVESKEEAGEDQTDPAAEETPATIIAREEPIEADPIPEQQETVSTPVVEEVSPNEEEDTDEELSFISSEVSDGVATEKTTDQRPLKKSTGTRGRRSVKENSIAAEMVELPDDEELFKKQYYSMGEVTAMFNENHSLIRYWESEFDILKPKKNGKGDRFFRPIDVKNLYLIYDLLRRKKFTIEGAREYLKNNKKAEEKFAAIQSLQRIKGFFLELKANL